MHITLDGQLSIAILQDQQQTKLLQDIRTLLTHLPEAIHMSFQDDLTAIQAEVQTATDTLVAAGAAESATVAAAIQRGTDEITALLAAAPPTVPQAFKDAIAAQVARVTTLTTALGAETATEAAAFPKPQPSLTISPSSTQAAPGQLKVGVTQLLTVTDTVSGAAVDPSTLTFTPSPTGIVTVDTSGVVTAVAVGTAQIAVASASTGKSGLAFVQVS